MWNTVYIPFGSISCTSRSSWCYAMLWHDNSTHNSLLRSPSSAIIDTCLRHMWLIWLSIPRPSAFSRLLSGHIAWRFLRSTSSRRWSTVITGRLAASNLCSPTTTDRVLPPSAEHDYLVFGADSRRRRAVDARWRGNIIEQWSASTHMA